MTADIGEEFDAKLRRSFIEVVIIPNRVHSLQMMTHFSQLGEDGFSTTEPVDFESAAHNPLPSNLEL